MLFTAMAVIWGIPYLLIRVAVRQLDPGVLVLIRTAPAALLLAPVMLWRRQQRQLLANIGWIATFGVVEFGGPWYLMATSERHITSSLTSLLICAVPLFSVIAQRVRQTEEHIGVRRLVGLSVGTVGVALLVGLGIHGGSAPWIGLMLIVATCYALGPIILATKLQHVSGITVTVGSTSIVAIAWIPWSIAHWPRHVSSETWASISVLSIVCTAGAFVVFYELVKEVGSTRSVVVTYVNTALAVVLGIALLHEPLSLGIIIGFPLVLVGSIVATGRSVSTLDAELASDANAVINQ